MARPGPADQLSQGSYAGTTYAFTTAASAIYLHTFDGARWSPAAPITILQAGRGRLGADVRLNKDGAQTLWLIAAEPDGQVSTRRLVPRWIPRPPRRG
jgi:hypothetical protein